MKTKLIITAMLLLTTATNVLKAQKDDYIPMARENAQWLILSDYDDTPYPDEYYGYKIKGDTLINDTLYKKVYKREFEAVNGNYSEPYEMVDEYIYAGIRDDIENRKVYGRLFTTDICGQNNDTLFYDFNVQINDTNNWNMCTIQYENQYIVYDIFGGSFFGYNTKIFEIGTQFTFYYFFYEGIGSEGGLFEDPYYYELYRYCRDMTDQECLDGFIASTEKITKKNIIFSPNPVNDFVNISNINNLQINKIVITDITGKTILKINKNPFDKINVSKLKKGLYFISIYSKQQLIKTEKIIKQ